ncbi:hypothetical protein GCM10010317_097760 [Streptomyces mirabilis]|nr:hypothetical protein GCM10010317_097760 [Streptomyces mirabilis]
MTILAGESFRWEQLTDPALQRMAAVTRKYHYDRGHFDQHWAKVRSDASVLLRTVLAGGVVAGHAAVFGAPSERDVTYVVGRAHWGQGIATAALAELIRIEPASETAEAGDTEHGLVDTIAFEAAAPQHLPVLQQ